MWCQIFQTGHILNMKNTTPHLLQPTETLQSESSRKGGGRAEEKDFGCGIRGCGWLLATGLLAM